MKHAPLQLAALNGSPAHLHFSGKHTFIRQTEHGRLPGPQVIRVIQIMDKHQIGHLFDDFQRIGQPAGPENFPQTVDSVFQFTCYHCLLCSCHFSVFCYVYNYTTGQFMDISGIPVTTLFTARAITSTIRRRKRSRTGPECPPVSGKRPDDLFCFFIRAKLSFLTGRF